MTNVLVSVPETIGIRGCRQTIGFAPKESGKRWKMNDRHYEAYCAEGRYQNLLIRYTADTYTKIMHYARKILTDNPMIDTAAVKNHKGETIKVVRR